MSDAENLPVLVIGAGVAGITVAVEAAEAGREVVLVEREAAIGGRVSQLYQYFPKMCPPLCGMEINTRRLERNPRIRVLTGSEVVAAEPVARGWRVTVRTAPQYVTQRCTACDDCTSACPTTVSNPFNWGLDETKAIRMVHPQAWPQRYLIERDACPEGCTACVEACSYGAVDLDAEATSHEVEVASVVVATGWSPYPFEQLTDLGSHLPDVISNVQMERLASPSGPTGGRILRPSTGQPPRRVAFVQCAGSRDVNALPYCSGVCCLASYKQVQYVKQQLPEAEVAVYYIDRRAPGRNEEVLARIQELDGVRLVKGKVGTVQELGDHLRLRVEDTEAGRLLTEEADLVVLASGMVPNLKQDALPFGIERDDDGFGFPDAHGTVTVTGVARRPEDVAAAVRDATGAAARALVGRRA